MYEDPLRCARAAIPCIEAYDLLTLHIAQYIIRNVHWTCASSEDSDKPAHSRALLRIITWHLEQQGTQCFFMWTTKTLIRLRVRAVWFEFSEGAHVHGYVFWRCGSLSVLKILRPVQSVNRHKICRSNILPGGFLRLWMIYYRLEAMIDDQ